MTAGRTWDAVVVGAGPAGALAARELARRGRAVLLVDRELFPRRKVCGCCLSGRALAVLRSVGLGGLPAALGAVPLTAFHWSAGGRHVTLPLPDGAALSREALDAALVREAVAAGATFRPGTWADLAPQAGGTERVVRLRQGGQTHAVTARVVLAADGLGGRLLARAGGAAAAPAPGSRVGAGAVSAAAPDFYRPGTVYMAAGPGGYLGLVRLEDGRLDLAAAWDTAWLRRAGGPGSAAAALLAGAGWPLPCDFASLAWRGTPPLTRRPALPVGERVFALGDAAGYVEPFTGEGIGWALAAAAAVAPLAAAAWRPDRGRAWAAAFRRAVARRQLPCRAAAALLRRPRLAAAAVALLARAPALAAPVVRYLNRP